MSRLLTILPLLLVATSAAAQSSDTVKADLRCVVAGETMSASAEPRTRGAGGAMSIYYLGRLDAHGASATLADRLYAEAKVMTADEVNAEVKRCGAALQERGRALAGARAEVKKRALADVAAAPKPATPAGPTPQP